LTRPRTLALLFVITTAALAIQGYHPGLEDDAFYLAAIKRNLNPALFPHDADFFRLQFQATIFDKLIAESIRLTHLPIDLTIFFWQFAATFLIIAACRQIARRCFASVEAQWAAVLTVAVLLTIPISGTGISLTDQYLHPRALATAAILAAIVAILDQRRLRAAIFLFAAATVHIIMAAFGMSLCIFLAWRSSVSNGENRNDEKRNDQATPSTLMALAALPLPWLFEPASEAWRQAAATRHFNLLSHWAWYEWLGVIAPLFLLYIFARIARRHESSTLYRLSTSLLYYGIFQLAIALVIMLPPQLERLRPFEPMRFLHLVYLLMFLIAGGLLGQHVLGKHVYRWLLLFIPLSAGMFYAQRQMYPSTAHLELPGRAPSSDWLRAFAWIRQNTPSQNTPGPNTPTDALFALDPYYMQQPGEDFHGFRALAERSALADMVKDPGMVARIPSLAPRWLSEVTAAKNWQDFRPSDFQSLRNSFGVTWVVLAKSNAADQSSAGMICPYENQSVKVCRVE
jgi:hypothetical protein